jgi:hypothetical protein
VCSKRPGLGPTSTTRLPGPKSNPLEGRRCSEDSLKIWAVQATRSAWHMAMTHLRDANHHARLTPKRSVNVLRSQTISFVATAPFRPHQRRPC